ncbi:MAG: DUF6249 domain-containing protein [Prevotellaceae bacterium]|nr:DUF6249 domain-containing protein [Prevotellaceae bacterium]
MGNVFGGILAILGVFFCVPAAVVLIFWFLFKSIRRRNELKAEIFSKAIEKGVELPANFFSSVPKVKAGVHAWLICGIIFIALGVGTSLIFILLAFWKVRIVTSFVLGVIPLVLGLGFLLIHRFTNRNRQEQSEQK